MAGKARGFFLLQAVIRIGGHARGPICRKPKTQKNTTQAHQQGESPRPFSHSVIPFLLPA
jgi:hypothetical protein